MSKPLEKLKDGLLSATIWKNTTDEGKTRYSVTLARSYTTEGGDWKESSSFSPNELLKIAELARLAYQRIGEIKAQTKVEAKADEAAA